MLNLKPSIKSISKKKQEFIDVAKQVSPFFQEEGVYLNFKGYLLTINQYVQCRQNDIKTLNNLILDLILWSNFFGELESIVLNLKLKFENKQSYLLSFSLIPKVEKELMLNKHKLEQTKLFLKHIKIQKSLFEQLHYHCFSMYNESIENYVYRY